jgi:predicted nucleotidyltransferase
MKMSKMVHEYELDRDRLLGCGVGAVILFGSFVEGTAHPGSDIDIAVVFKDLSFLKRDPVNIFGILYDEFSEKIGGNIDIIYLHEAPLSLQFNAVMNGIPIFCSSKEFLYDYKEKITLLYLDFCFFEKILDEAYTG